MDTTQEVLNTTLATIAFDGINGHFSFQGLDKGAHPRSDPLPLPVYYMCTDHTHIVHLVATYGTDDRIQLAAGKGLGFCA
jgi:hypothetical protein